MWAPRNELQSISPGSTSVVIVPLFSTRSIVPLTGAALNEFGLKSGQLSGLSRVRMLSMNDAHLYMREDQIEQEIDSLLQIGQVPAREKASRLFR